MKNVFSISHEEKRKKTGLGCLNGFGIIVDDEVVIYQHVNKVPIRISRILKVSFRKRRNYFVNLCCFCLVIICFFGFINIEKNLSERLVLVTVFVVAIILTVKIKIMEYTFLIVSYYGLNFIELKVKSNLINDAETLLKQINEIINQERRLFENEIKSVFFGEDIKKGNIF